MCVVMNTACEVRVASTVKLTFLNLFSCQHDRSGVRGSGRGLLQSTSLYSFCGAKENSEKS
jgi:hypothetical protein